MTDTSVDPTNIAQSLKLRVHPAPGVHILVAGCTILKGVHPSGASFFQALNISIDLCAHAYWARSIFSRAMHLVNA